MATHVVVRGNGIDWGKALVAGIASMAVFAAIVMAFAWAVRGASPWRPLDIFGAIVLAQPTSDSLRIFPALAMLRGWSTLIAYAIQGGLAAGLYKALVRTLVATTPQYAEHDMRRLREVSLT